MRKKKRGPGRPALGPDAASEVLQIKVTAAERAEVEAAVKRAGDGMTVSRWGRPVLLAAARAKRTN